jgi:hypothetical protein
MVLATPLQVADFTLTFPSIDANNVRARLLIALYTVYSADSWITPFHVYYEHPIFPNLLLSKDH